MRNTTIVESNVEPSKENLWLYKGELRQFGPNGWEAVSASDNAPKYIFKVIRDFPTLRLSPGYSTTFKVYSYTEQDGVKKMVTPHVFGAFDIVDIWIRTSSGGYYLVDIFPKGLNDNELVIIEGENDRQIVVPVIVSGYDDDAITTPAPTITTTSTTTKLPVSVKVKNSTSLGLVVHGIEIEGVVGTSPTPINIGQEIICYPRPNYSIGIHRLDDTILPQLIIRDAVTHTEIPNSRSADGRYYYIDCDNIFGLIQEGLTTIEVVEDTTSSLE